MDAIRLILPQVVVGICLHWSNISWLPLLDSLMTSMTSTVWQLLARAFLSPNREPLALLIRLVFGLHVLLPELGAEVVQCQVLLVVKAQRGQLQPRRGALTRGE